MYKRIMPTFGPPSPVKFKLALNSKPIFCRRRLKASLLRLALSQRYLFPGVIPGGGGVSLQ